MYDQTKLIYYDVLLAAYLVHIPLVYSTVMLSLSGIRKLGMKNSKGNFLLQRKKVRRKDDDDLNLVSTCCLFIHKYLSLIYVQCITCQASNIECSYEKYISFTNLLFFCMNNSY